ncbi:uncharacterized protein ELE39_001724 [Cryptosporidium sp. chipmunk genotype I]|uniref:uncharacterized protein n=1 Tax=Cryptosporidium sp. chipmunk genotype I TaxID=1280935 RepID=UPI00351AA183|nr:hypothetical protein ELE39_001724 [Cryptosporidium sp. chipmunk genotype I]
MMQFPELLETYLLKKKKLEDLSPIYIELLDWLESEKENYKLIINKLIQLCHYLLSYFNPNEQISPHLNCVCTDILSIIYDRSSKYINFPDSCYCKINNPFENMNGYELEYEFWKILCDLSMCIALKCSPKEGYVIFIEVILGSISLPIFSDKAEFFSKKTLEESLAMREKINPVSFSEEKKILPRFYRYLGLYYSLICISRMKRNKAQFITTVCSLVLRKLVYDIECNSLYLCNCHSKITGIYRYCTTIKMLFLQYLVDSIVQLLFDCLVESKSDAEYKNQVGIFNSELSEGNVNVTQHTIYSFLMKVLENLLVIDLHNVEILNNFGISSSNKNINQNIYLFSSALTNKPLESILNIISSGIFASETHTDLNNDKNKIEWVEIIYKLCYNISYVSPYSMIDTLNNIPICVHDVETQSGDLDVTPLTLSCYAYALFVILETKYPIATNYLYPKNIISLTTKLNIIYRTTTTFLTFSDSKKLGYEIDCASLRNQDILLSYFNAFQPKNISKSLELIYMYYALIFKRLQEKAYFLLDNNINNFIKCREIVPSLFNTIYGLNWHQSILAKQVIFSFNRNRSEITPMKNVNKLSSKSRKNVNLYSNLFDKFTSSLNECYHYSVLFNFYYNLMEFQKNLFSKNLINSANVIIGILNVLRGILWKDICRKGCDALTYFRDLNKIIMFSSTFLTKFKKVDLESSQSDKMVLIILNLIKLILLSYKNNGTRFLKDLVKFLVEEPNIIKKYILHIKSFISEIQVPNFNQFGIVLFIIQDIEEIIECFSF